MKIVKGKPVLLKSVPDSEPIDAEVITQPVTKLTSEVAEQLVLEATQTPSLSQAAANVGVPYRQLRYWIKLGDEGDDRYAYFAAEMHRVRATHEQKYLQNLEAIAGDDNPRMANARLRANEILLKKLFPTQWGDQVFVSTMIEREADGFDLSVLPTPVLREFMKTLKALRAHNEGEREEEVKRLVEKINKAKDEGDHK